MALQLAFYERDLLWKLCKNFEERNSFAQFFFCDSLNIDNVLVCFEFCDELRRYSLRFNVEVGLELCVRNTHALLCCFAIQIDDCMIVSYLIRYIQRIEDNLVRHELIGKTELY